MHGLLTKPSLDRTESTQARLLLYALKVVGGREKELDTLIDYSFNINAKDCKGDPVLFSLVKHATESPADLYAVKLCLKHNPDLDQKNKNGLTVLDLFSDLSSKLSLDLSSRLSPPKKIRELLTKHKEDKQKINPI